jgi:hypothetical protein
MVVDASPALGDLARSRDGALDQTGGGGAQAAGVVEVGDLGHGSLPGAATGRGRRR